MDAFGMLMEKAMAESIPLFAHLELTAGCNLRCSHCYVSPPNDTEAELTTAEWVDTLDQLAAENCLFLTFSGGEPLLRADLMDIVAAAVDRGFAYRIFTNATLVDERLADALVQRLPVAVEVSVYSADAATHDGITRIRGSFDRTIHGIRLLVERGIRVVVKSPMMQENYMQLPAMREQAEQLGCEFKYDAVITARIDGDTAPLAHRLSDEDYRTLFSQGDGSLRVTGEVDLDQPFCNAGRARVCIGPTGEVYPCVALQISAGQLRRKTFSEIWRTGGILNELRSVTKRDAHECVHCRYLPYCMRCPGMAYVEDGDWRGPSRAACQLARVRYELAQEQSKKRKGLPSNSNLWYSKKSESEENSGQASVDVFSQERGGGCPE